MLPRTWAPGPVPAGLSPGTGLDPASIRLGARAADSPTESMGYGPGPAIAGPGLDRRWLRPCSSETIPCKTVRANGYSVSRETMC
jgi:hypothetical protein